MQKKNSIILVLVIIFTNLSLILFTNIKTFELLFPTSVIMIVNLIIIFRAFFQFDDGNTNLGEKHKENPINMISAVLMFIPIIVLFVQLTDQYEFLSSAFIVIIVVVSLLLIYLVIAYITVYVKSTNDGIVISYYHIRNRTIKYAEIEKIWINKLTNAIVLKDTNGNKVYIDMMLYDIHLILNELYRKTDKELTKDLFQGLEKFYKGIFLKDNLTKLDAYNETQ